MSTRLYVIPASHPSIAVQLMLEHKGIEYKRTDLLPVISKGVLRAVGFPGVTVPALKIDGEIGQQLGYLNANTIGIVNFALFLIIGWVFAHRTQIKEWRERRKRESELRRRA